jgi:uncharacterized SAM-binding protein YcdF (DUF218 family)
VGGRRILLGSVAVVLALYLLRFHWLPPIASWLNVSEPRLPVDYVIPLPGGNDTRPFAAAALVRAGLADRAAVLINPATPDVSAQIALPMHQVTHQVLQLRGVPEDDILLLRGVSDSTFSDIQIIAGLIEREPNATIAIVTSPSHTRRVRWTISQILPQCGNQVCVIATFNDHFDQRIWWQDQGAMHEILSEYLKLGYYLMKYSSLRLRAGFAVLTLIVIAVLITLVRRRRTRSQAAELA